MLTQQQSLAVDLSPTFMNIGTTDETFKQSKKQDSFRHILKSSTSMYESSGSQFTTGIQSGADVFDDESRFIMTFLTMLGVMEICSFRIILEGKTGKEIPPKSSKLEFSEKFLGNYLALSEAEDNTSGALNRGGIADLPLLRTPLAILQKSREPSL